MSLKKKKKKLTPQNKLKSTKKNLNKVMEKMKN